MDNDQASVPKPNRNSRLCLCPILYEKSLKFSTLHLLVFVAGRSQLPRLPPFLLKNHNWLAMTKQKRTQTHFRRLLLSFTLLRRMSEMRDGRCCARRARGREPRRGLVWSCERWGTQGSHQVQVKICPKFIHNNPWWVMDGPDGQWERGDGGRWRETLINDQWSCESRLQENPGTELQNVTHFTHTWLARRRK